MGIETDNISTGGGSMKPSTPTPKPANANLTVKDKIANLKTRHESTFKALGLTEVCFLPKTIYGTPLECVIFPSEFRLGKDIYTEKVSRDYVSEDPSRTLYKLKYRKDFNQHYKTSSFGQDVKYHVPFTDFEKVIVEKPKMDFSIPDPDAKFLDDPIADMTIRDVAAILWKRPVSGKDWLNDLIKNQK